MTTPQNQFRHIRPATEMPGPRRKKWLIPGLLPQRELSFLAGDEGIGKSAFSIYLVSAITSGKSDPGLGISTREPGHVLLYSTEDDWSENIAPALLANGVDRNYLHVIFSDDKEDDGYPLFDNALRKEIQEYSELYGPMSLIIVDTFLNTCSENLDTNNGQKVIGVLSKWQKLARSTGASVLCLHHTNRSVSSNPRDLWAGSNQIRKRARMALMAKDNEDDTFTLGVDKANGVKEHRAVIFRKTTTPVTVHYEEEDVPSEENIFVVEYVGESARTIGELVADKAEGDTFGEIIGDNIAALLQYLLSCGGSSTRQGALKDLKGVLTVDQLAKTATRAENKGLITRSKSGVQAVYTMTEKGRSLIQDEKKPPVLPTFADVLPSEKEDVTSSFAVLPVLPGMHTNGDSIDEPPALFAPPGDCVVCGKSLDGDSGMPGVPLCGLNDDNHRAARSEYDNQGLIPAYLTVSSQPWRPEERKEA